MRWVVFVLAVTGSWGVGFFCQYCLPNKNLKYEFQVSFPFSRKWYTRFCYWSWDFKTLLRSGFYRSTQDPLFQTPASETLQTGLWKLGIRLRGGFVWQCRLLHMIAARSQNAVETPLSKISLFITGFSFLNCRYDIYVTEQVVIQCCNKQGTPCPCRLLN